MGLDEFEYTSDEIITAEAELHAAQEALEQAKQRLEDLKKEHSALHDAAQVSLTPASANENQAGNAAAFVPVSTATSAPTFCSSSRPQADTSAEQNTAPTEPQAPPVASDPTSWTQQPPTSMPPLHSAPAGMHNTYQQPPSVCQQSFYAYQQPYYQQPYRTHAGLVPKDHIAAGLLAIFLGFLGIHKFYLGYNVSGFIMMGVTVIGGLLTLSFAGWVVWVIAIIEGIMYLTKSQTEFEQAYVSNNREWF